MALFTLPEDRRGLTHSLEQRENEGSPFSEF